MQPAATTPLLTATPSYGVGERLFRTAVFQIGALSGSFEHFLIGIYKFFSEFKCSQNILDEARAAQTLNAFTRLGADIAFLTPRDGKARIQTMHLKAAVLREKLQQLGARWEKIQDQGKSLLVIIPPHSITEQWTAFEKDLLKFKWNKRPVTINGEAREVIVTCENAERINPLGAPVLFMHANSASVSFVMLTRRIGFYLGCAQDVCFYDPRGTWRSSGISSEAGYYNDIDTVYDHVKNDYDPRRIWVSSACGGSCPSAHLKARVHGSVNFIYESGFTNLYEDYIVPQGWFVTMFAKRYREGIASKDIPAEHKPRETGYNVNELWKDLNRTDIGKVLIINADNDQRLSNAVAARNVALAQRVNAQTHHIVFHSTSKDPHMDRYFNYPEARAQVLAHIFG